MGIDKGVIVKPGVVNDLSLDNENSLVLNCCCLSLSQTRIENIIEKINEGIDWDILVKNATWHRLLPLVSSHLTKPEISKHIPEITVGKMRRYGYASLARNMLLQNELSRITGLFNEQGIKIIVLKGAALLGTIYENIALRPMNDIDVLVRTDDLFRAEAIALQQGYNSARGTVYIEREENLRHLPNLVHTEKQIMLEIHRHITDVDGPFSNISLDDIWSRARPLSIQGTPALTLSSEDHLIHLATNFLLDRRYSSQHSLGQLCDISELIIRYRDEMDWTLVEKIAAELRIHSSLFYPLYCCKTLLDTPVPEGPYNNLKPSDFDYEQAELFLKRRVIDDKAWLIHNLVDHESDYSVSESLISGMKRLLPAPKRFFQKGRFDSQYCLLYLKTLCRTLSRIFQTVLKPSELKENLTLDKWLHDLYAD